MGSSYWEKPEVPGIFSHIYDESSWLTWHLQQQWIVGRIYTNSMYDLQHAYSTNIGQKESLILHKTPRSQGAAKMPYGCTRSDLEIVMKCWLKWTWFHWVDWGILAVYYIYCLFLDQNQHVFCKFILLASLILSLSLAEPSPSCLSQQKDYCKLQRNLNTFLRTFQNGSYPVLKDHLTIRIRSTSRQHQALPYPIEIDSSSKQTISSVQITCHVWGGRFSIAFTSLRTHKPFSLCDWSQAKTFLYN